MGGSLAELNPSFLMILMFSKDAKSDLVNVLSRLEAHWVVLEAELTEINKDITQCEQCVQKYGEYFTFPLQHLKDLKKAKKQKMKEIIQVRAVEMLRCFPI